MGEQSRVGVALVERSGRARGKAGDDGGEHG
jgi:hypothetical protein